MNSDVAEPYKIPRELDRRPPRRVRRRAGTLGCGVVFARLFITPHVLIGIGLLLWVPLSAAVVTVGESYQGQFVELRTSKGKKGKDRYHLHFSYDAGGRKHFTNRDLSREQYDQFGDWSTGDSSRPP